MTHSVPPSLISKLLAVCLLCTPWMAGCGDSGTGSDGPNRHEPSSPDDRSANQTGKAATLIRFRDFTKESGVDFTYRNGHETEHYSILESIGGGVAMLDYDADGAVDLFFPGGGVLSADRRISGLPGGLFRNGGRGTFSETTQSAGLGTPLFYSHGAAVGDYNSDGFCDLLVTGYGGLALYENLGDGTFREVAASAGLDPGFWYTGAAWGDVNGDGMLDLYVVQYVDWSFENHPRCLAAGVESADICSPRKFNALPDRLFENRGDGTFQDVSDQAGLKPGGKGLGVLIGDVDLDGDLDIYVANDTTPNFLYENDGQGRFREIGRLSSAAFGDTGTPDGSMGVDLGDFNGDGLPDLWVANFESESFALYRNIGYATFDHVSRSTGITDVGGLYVGWGTAFFDADNDADEDLISVNGHAIRFPLNASVRQRPLLFENRQGERYVNVADQAGPYLSSAWEARGLAVGDLDGDGRDDVVISHQNEPVAVLINQTRTSNRSLRLRMIATNSQRDAVGAVVRIATEGERVQMKQVRGGGSYLSACQREVHVGLAGARVATVQVRWPAGGEETYRDLPPGRWTLVEGRGIWRMPR